MIGVVIWYLFLQSGIHSTISGVILAFVIPAKPRLNVGKYIEDIRRIIAGFPTMESGSIVLTNEQIARLKEVESASDRVISPLQSLEDNLHGAVNYLILPLLLLSMLALCLAGAASWSATWVLRWQPVCCLANSSVFIRSPGWLSEQD